MIRKNNSKETGATGDDGSGAILNDKTTMARPTKPSPLVYCDPINPTTMATFPHQYVQQQHYQVYPQTFSPGNGAIASLSS